MPTIDEIEKMFTQLPKNMQLSSISRLLQNLETTALENPQKELNMESFPDDPESEMSLQLTLQEHALWLSSEKQQGTQAQLQGANLRGVNLRGVNLQEANLEGAYLQGPIYIGPTW